MVGVLSERVRMMQDYQSSFIILAENIDTQSFWNRTSVVNWPTSPLLPEEVRPFICIPINSRDIKDNFPTSFYGLSTVSTIYWDDVSANEMSDEQKEAILDWLNQGGRLIINGPQTIASVANSFLSPYVPLTGLTPMTTNAEQLAQTMNNFSVRRAADIRELPLDPVLVPGETIAPQALDDSTDDADQVEPKIAVKFDNVIGNTIASGLCNANLSDSGNWVPQCEGLLAEAQVGQGRICMSTFDMSGEQITNWNSYGSFLHAAAFRLPSRTWSTNLESPTYLFADTDSGAERNLSTYSKVRTSRIALGSESITHRNVDTASPQLGSAWNDARFNNLALRNIENTSGIKVPPIDSLIRMIGIYLLVLVPANWCVFRVLNRLEWAWFSIPVIAVSSAAIFTYALQIQIGFARSQNSIGWLQLQDGYHRAALSRQTSIYTSLSSRFRLSLPNDQGFILPISRQSRGDQGKQEVNYTLYDEYGSGIRNQPIRSHTSVIFQSDELVDVGGQIDVTDKGTNPKVANNSTLQLQDVVWIHKDENKTTYHWIGSFTPSNQVTLSEVKEYSRDKIVDLLRQSFSELQNDDLQNEPNTNSSSDGIQQMMLEYLFSDDRSDNSDILVGWTKNILTRLTVYPDPAQKNDITLVSLECREETASDVRKDLLLPPRNLYSRSPAIAE
jgi:hypothetical protein